MDSLREATQILNETDCGDTKKIISKILVEIKSYQEKVKKYINSNYCDFLPNLANNELYLDEGDKLIREVDDLLQNIENETKKDLYAANQELRQYIEELQEVSIGLRVSYKILSIDELFESLVAAQNSNENLVVMDIIGKIKSLIDDPTDKIFNRLECYQNIKIKYHIEAEMLLHNLKQCFEQLVQFSEKPFQNTKSITLKISKDENQLHDTIVALFNARYNPKKMCEFLMDNCFEPIVMKPVSLDFSDEDPDFYELSLSFSAKDLCENLRPNYKTVLKNMQMVILCLANMNIQINDTVCVFNIFGDHMKEKLMNLLIHECFIYSIPETMDEMNNCTLVDDIEQFHKFLIEQQFLRSENDKDLLTYSGKIGMLFRKRFCVNIVDNATEIMRKDLHDMSLIAENTPTDAVSSNPFIFPRCMVSKSTLELIKLMDKVLRQIQTTDKEISKGLVLTVSLILNKYLTEIPSYHEKLLENIPQQTALFHNNCMLLAHWTTTNSDKGIETFQIIVKSLQKLGTDYLLKQQQNQRKQLFEILNDFDLSGAISELDIGHQKIIRQCLRQLDLLKNVWQTILPYVVYNKTMSSLLNDFCSEIITKIMAMEDISTSVSRDLVIIIDSIMERAPSIFQDRNEVIQVKSWMKLTQLKMILNASLTQITEQWCDGKGSLTLNYKAEDIKHLIRALFKNTDRRSNALASIL